MKKLLLLTSVLLIAFSIVGCEQVSTYLNQNEDVNFTLGELTAYNGKDCNKEYTAVNSVVYDETEIEEMLGRSLTEQEQAALEIVKAISEDVWESEEFTPEQEQALEIVFELYEDHFDDDEVDETEIEEMLGRSLTEQEQAALEIVKAIPEDVWESEEFTPEQEQALEIVFELYEDHFDDDDEVDDDMYVSTTNLPEAILDYLNTNYPNIGIDEVEIEDGMYEIELNNDLELYFDLNGNFLSVEYDD